MSGDFPATGLGLGGEGAGPAAERGLPARHGPLHWETRERGGCRRVSAKEVLLGCGAVGSHSPALRGRLTPTRGPSVPGVASPALAEMRRVLGSACPARGRQGPSWGTAGVTGRTSCCPLGPDRPPPAAPLKGIPKQAPFRSPTAPSVFSPAGNRTPIPPSRTPLRKERGVKVGAPLPPPPAPCPGGSAPRALPRVPG